MLGLQKNPKFQTSLSSPLSLTLSQPASCVKSCLADSITLITNKSEDQLGTDIFPYIQQYTFIYVIYFIEVWGPSKPWLLVGGPEGLLTLSFVSSSPKHLKSKCVRWVSNEHQYQLYCIWRKHMAYKKEHWLWFKCIHWQCGMFS